MNDYTKFQEFMAGLAEVFDKKLSKIVLDIYWRALGPYSNKQCINAFNEAFIAFKFFPKPAELIETIIGDTGQIEDRALLEANKIVEHLNFHGAIKHPKIDDLITERLMTHRWPYQVWARDVLEAELKWWVKEFCDAYRAYDGDPKKLVEGPKEMRELASGMFESI